jgi:ribonuclease HII
LDFGVGIVSHETIDEINIHRASILAMKKSVENLKTDPDFLFLDGIHKVKTLIIKQQPIIGGDMKVLSIAAASIVAKVARDEILHQLHETYPQYGFNKHKGYGTKFHREALAKHGITPAHRLSFGFVAECLKKYHSAKYFHNLVKIPAFAGMGNNI